MKSVGLLEKLFNRETGENEEQESATEIVAVTGPEAMTADREDGENSWSVSIMLTAWRLSGPGEPVHEEPKKLSARADDETLHWLQRLLKKDSVVKLRVRGIAGGFALEEIVESCCEDPEMLEIFSRHQEPVYYEDEVLGQFSLNRALGVYERMVNGYGTEIRLLFEVDEEERMQMAVETARTLLSNLDFWIESAAAYAVDELLSEENEDRLFKAEPAMTRDSFLAALWLNDIWVMPSGAFQFCYNDGGIFGGHSIYVDGNVYGRFTGVRV